MPIYEYYCAGCDKTSEIMQKMSDAPLETCETCGKSIKKLVSRTSFQLKGTGWYATDYKKSPASSAAPVTSAPTSAPAATEAPKSAKPSGETGGSCGGGACS